MIFYRLIAPWLVLFAGTSYAESTFGKRFELVLPVACTPNIDCFIQNYVSHNKNDVAVDYRCGSLTIPRHFGTDFRVEHEGVLTVNGGIPVLAAATGTVSLTKSGQAKGTPFMQFLQNRMAANACGTRVQIDHKNGWQTHYCHLMPGSVTVHEGEYVKAGQEIARMGMSGNTTFPHLHFEVWQYGNMIDPFVGHKNFTCGSNQLYSLWTPELSKQLAYRPTDVLGGGFTFKEPLVTAAKAGGLREKHIAADVPMLVLWSEIYGIRAGDSVKQEILAPNGANLAVREESYDTNAALVMQSVRKEREGAAWLSGNYTGRITLIREGSPLLVREWVVEIN